MDIQKRKALKQASHHLYPVVMIGSKGLTDSVIAEIDQSLTVHELIKIKVGIGDKNERQLIAETICEKVNAEFVNSIGRIIVIYRKNEEAK